MTRRLSFFLATVASLLIMALFIPHLFRTTTVRADSDSTVSIDYPLRGSIFPPDITAPTFLWHDSNPLAQRWSIVINFAKHPDPLRFESGGDLMQPGEVDRRAGTDFQLSPEQASTHTWRPSDEAWRQIKQISVDGPALITITGYSATPNSPALASATTAISTSVDPVGAPVFYRDVPIMISPDAGKGAIQPLPPSALPLIKWELRYINEPNSHTMMENLPTCANCHSFSADAKTLGIDMDGPRNDKGLYAIVNLTKVTTISNRDVIRWASF